MLLGLGLHVCHSPDNWLFRDERDKDVNWTVTNGSQKPGEMKCIKYATICVTPFLKTQTCMVNQTDNLSIEPFYRMGLKNYVLKQE